MKNKLSLLIHPEELSMKWIDRARSCGLTTLALRPRGGYIAPISLVEMLDMLDTEEYRKMLDYAAENGLEIEYECHAAGYLLPRDMFETHPEWFRLDESGNRNPDCNFCVSNEEALEYVSDRAASLAEKLYLSTHNYYFWLDDKKDVDCRCDKCASLSPSDKNLTVMNRMLEKIKKKIPDAKLCCLCYQDTLEVPKKVTPDKDIFLEYAPIERDMHSPVRNQGYAEKVSALLDFFGKENSKVLEYWFDNSMFSDWKKPPKKFVPEKDVIKDDIAFYKELGFENVSSFACFLGEDYEELFGEPDVSDIKQ
ncbi:MAG: DUF4838 domain-containing protein [Clostridiales bacterium]|nr:DUF4838 domain-containing protein [Clostridiales bacterium]